MAYSHWRLKMRLMAFAKMAPDDGEIRLMRLKLAKNDKEVKGKDELRIQA